MAEYTRDPPKEISLPPRLPLVGLMDQRGSTADRDARVVNGYVERTEDGAVHIVKRPGLVVKWDLGEEPGMFPAGLYEDRSFRGYISDTLEISYEIFAGAAPLGGTLGTHTYSSGFFSEAQRFFWAERVPTGESQSIIFAHNRYGAWLLDFIFVQVPFLGTSLDLSCDTTDASAIVATASTVGITVYAGVTGAGIPAATSVVSVDSGVQFTISAPATATATATLTFTAAGPNGGDPTVWTAPNRRLVAGVADLNGMTAVIGQNAAISVSNRNAPQVWDQLAFLFAYAQQDDPIYIARHLAYLVAFKTTSVEFFRDAGVSPGSPLARVEGLYLGVGAVNFHSVASIDDTIFWASNTQAGVRSAWLLERGQPREVAGPVQRRVLAAMTPSYTFSLSIEGHTFFFITDIAAGITLVYDKATEFWSYWQALGETYFPFCAASYHAGEVLLQHLDGRYIYKLDPETFLDAGTPYALDIFPPEFDAGMRQTKYLSSMFAIADQEDGGRLDVRVNDQNRKAGAWSSWRSFDLGKERPVLENCGSFTKRAFHFRYLSPKRCRLRAIELEMMPGVL